MTYPIERIRRAVNGSADLDPDGLADLVEETVRSLTFLATTQASELARKDAALERVGLVAKDGLRPGQYAAPVPDPPPGGG
jgi:hypothetical protein